MARRGGLTALDTSPGEHSGDRRHRRGYRGERLSKQHTPARASAKFSTVPLPNSAKFDFGGRFRTGADRRAAVRGQVALARLAAGGGAAGGGAAGAQGGGGRGGAQGGRRGLSSDAQWPEAGRWVCGQGRQAGRQAGREGVGRAGSADRDGRRGCTRTDGRTRTSERAGEREGALGGREGWEGGRDRSPRQRAAREKRAKREGPTAVCAMKGLVSRRREEKEGKRNLFGSSDRAPEQTEHVSCRLTGPI